MVDTVVSIAIGKLDAFITQQVNIRRGVKEGVRWLKDELGFLQITVRDAEAKQGGDLICVWINSVRDVANDAVRILDSFGAVQEKHAGLRSCICICKKEVNLYDIGMEIESLKERVIEIKRRREDYGISNILANLSVQPKKKTLLKPTSFEKQVDMVGVEDDVKTLLEELIREDSSLNVISIHGMGGLGKTTLARKLYNSNELKHFQSRAWVCVSKEYKLDDVLKMIIKSFMKHEQAGHELELLNMELDGLMRHLHKLLDRDRYLVVIDDIWDIEAWEDIKKAFPENNNGSRVIVTTRNAKVAEQVDDRCFVHKLRFLTKDESWELFRKRAKPGRNLEKLGEEMVGKCGGLPLAIVVLSGLLLRKKTRKDWSDVKDHIWRHLKDGSVKIEEILSLSYDDLTYPMSQCFLYLARFPEDHSIDVDKLKLLWIAEEFISEADQGDGVTLEVVAEEYLNELINRNMIQIAALYLDGQVSAFRVHDLIRDLAIGKARKNNFMGIFDSNKLHESPTSVLLGKPRHAIYNGLGKYLELLKPSDDDKNLRSLTLINETGILVYLEEIRSIYTRFKYLKVLDLTSVRSNGIPEQIWDLVHLKFLGLIRVYNHKKPVEISRAIRKLKNLQTLRGAIRSEYAFPGEISEVKELRHIDYVNISGSLDIGLHQTKLQTLRNIVYKNWITINTVNLTNLHTLFIKASGSQGDEYTLDSIACLTGLQVLFLEFLKNVITTIEPLSFCKRLKRVFLSGKMKDISGSDLRFLPASITELTLLDSGLTEDPMPILGSLSDLNALSLSHAYWGEKMVCSPDAFHSLQFLKLGYLPNVQQWEVEDTALPFLKGFHIVDCKKLKMVPQRLQYVPPIPDVYTWMSFN